VTGRSILTVLRGAASEEACASWLQAIDAAGVFPAAGASVRTDAVADLSALDVWSSMSAGARLSCTNVLGPVALDLDQCWIRRQGPPGAGNPHSWHQDGALRFEFLRAPHGALEDDALLRMVTCWITLTPCGLDAPGLELVADSPQRLLMPLELRDEAVDAEWSAAARLRPVLAVGDAVVFTGDLLHRTHVTPGMTLGRTSIELRCFPADALPARLDGDRFIAVA
jgi:hypothetical protein